jgi:hypothetical protein
MLYQLSYSHRRGDRTDNDYNNCSGIAVLARAWVAGYFQFRSGRRDAGATVET